jgi:hypothetical protein
MSFCADLALRMREHEAVIRHDELTDGGIRKPLMEDVAKIAAILSDIALKRSGRSLSTWHAARTPGPLRAFWQRVAAKRGGNIATVAVARKLAVIAWHLLSDDEEYAFARPSLVREKLRRLELLVGAERRTGQAARCASSAAASSTASSSSWPSRPRARIGG